MKKFFVFFTVASLITACSTLQVEEPTAVDEPVSVATQIGDLWGLNVGFDFGQAIERRGDVFYDQSNEPVAYVDRIVKFDARVDDLGVWAMPVERHQALLAADDACEVLRASAEIDRFALWLPFPLDRPFLCSSEKKGEMILISAVGLGHPFERLQYINTTLLVVREEDVVILSGLVPDEQLNAIDNGYLNRLLGAYPLASFPNASWKQLYDEVEAKIVELISNEDPGVIAALEQVENIASTVE